MSVIPGLSNVLLSPGPVGGWVGLTGCRQELVQVDPAGSGIRTIWHVRANESPGRVLLGALDALVGTRL